MGLVVGEDPWREPGRPAPQGPLLVGAHSVQIVPSVQGPVIEVAVAENQQVNKDDLLFRIDPTLYQSQVDTLTAQLDLARTRLDQARRLAERGAGPANDVEQFTGQVEQLEAQLAGARWNLEETTVRAITFINKDVEATMAASIRVGPLFILTVALLSLGCSRAVSEPSACDGLIEKTIGITREEYSPCAGEILATLDSLEPPLRRFVLRGDEEARTQAETHYKRVRHLMDEVGFTADVWREAREGAGRTVERWPDGAMRQFNSEVGIATAQYMSALESPNDASLKEGQRRHATAGSAYARFR